MERLRKPLRSDDQPLAGCGFVVTLYFCWYSSQFRRSSSQRFLSSLTPISIVQLDGQIDSNVWFRRQRHALEETHDVSLEARITSHLPAQAPLQLYAATISAVFWYFRMVTGKGYMSFTLASIIHASFQQQVPHSWASPSTIHNSAITPINIFDFFNSSC